MTQPLRVHDLRTVNRIPGALLPRLARELIEALEHAIDAVSATRTALLRD